MSITIISAITDARINKRYKGGDSPVFAAGADVGVGVGVGVNVGVGVGVGVGAGVSVRGFGVEETVEGDPDRSGLN